MKRITTLLILTLSSMLLPQNASAVTTIFTDFMSTYHLGPATVGGQGQIPDNKSSLSAGSTETLQYGNIIKYRIPGGFTVSTAGYYELSYGISSMSGGNVGIFAYSVSFQGILPYSKIIIPPNAGIMMTHSYIAYLSSGSYELWNLGPNPLTLDGSADSVTAYLTVKKL